MTNLENPLKGLQSGNPTPTAEPTVSDGGAGSPGYNPPPTKFQWSQWRARRRYDSFMDGQGEFVSEEVEVTDIGEPSAELNE